MEKSHIKDSALSTLIKQSITEDIILGKIQPGEKLIEAKYAEEFGTSRAPIREAFYLLTLEGFVRKIPRKGTVVKGFSIEEIRDLLEIRNFLEDLAIQTLSTKDSSAYLSAVNPILLEMQNCQQSKEYSRLNYEFHYQLIKACGSEVIRNIYSCLGTPLLSLQTMSFMEENNIKKSMEEHCAMITFIRTGKWDAARELLRYHNAAVFPRIEKHLAAN